MEEQIRFEFLYAYGQKELSVHVGSLPIAEFEKLTHGEGRSILRIQDVSKPDRDSASYVPLRPHGGEPEGASGAFIDELLRRALVFAADAGSPEVHPHHVDQAFKELLIAGGELTRNFLGYASRPPTFPSATPGS